MQSELGKQNMQAIKRSIPTFDHLNRPCAPAKDQYKDAPGSLHETKSSRDLNPNSS